MSTNQSFVGAYARRHRSARLADPNGFTHPDSNASPANQQPEEDAPGIVTPQINIYPMPEGLAERSVSVEHTASAAHSPEQKTIWIDGSEGQMFRVDTPPSESPHTESPRTDRASTAEPDQSPVATVAPKSNWTGAAWEVDGFAIPESVADLFFEESFFQSIAEHMYESVNSGLRSVLVTSISKGAGRSTVAIGTAIAAAATGLRVALVDLDIDTPDLSDTLRLDTEADWVAAIRHGGSLESVSIVSVEDRVTLIPLGTTDVRTLPVTSLEIDRLFQKLTDCFDLVLFDGSTADSWSLSSAAGAIDSCLIVRDARSDDQQSVLAAADQLRLHGIRGVGVVDNFCG